MNCELYAAMDYVRGGRLRGSFSSIALYIYCFLDEIVLHLSSPHLATATSLTTIFLLESYRKSGRLLNILDYLGNALSWPSTSSLVLNFVPKRKLNLTIKETSRLAHLDQDHKNHFSTQGSTTKNVISRGYVYFLPYSFAS